MMMVKERMQSVVDELQIGSATMTFISFELQLEHGLTTVAIFSHSLDGFQL
jgi:hypothetical protein